MMRREKTTALRLRFAPASAGHLRLDAARIAVLNWLYARRHGGAFILRFDDVQSAASAATARDAVLEDLRWLGLDWDEGPDVGGPRGPYRQAERSELYAPYCARLVELGLVYPCYCSESAAYRSANGEQSVSVFPSCRAGCRDLGESERRRLESEGRKPVHRFRIPEGKTGFDDLIRGRVTLDHGRLEDFPVWLPDGRVSGYLATAVDDAVMGISHVIGSEEELAETAKRILLHRALDLAEPTFAHVPPPVAADGAPLGERPALLDVGQLRRFGYLPEVVVAFLATGEPDERDWNAARSVDRLIEGFDLREFSSSPCVLDLKTLRRANAACMRSLPARELAGLARPFLKNAGFELPGGDRLARMVALVSDRVSCLSELPMEMAFFFEDPSPGDVGLIALFKKDSSQKVLWSFLRRLRLVEELTADVFKHVMAEVGDETGVLGRDLWTPVGAALTGRLQGPSTAEVAEILGKETCERRIERALGVK